MVPGKDSDAESKVVFQREVTLSSRKTTKERVTMSNNSNSINVPQAKEAMNQFKMQAAQDLGVLFT